MSAHDQFVLQMGGGLTWVAKRNELNAIEVMTLSALVLVDGQDGCHPSQRTIAETSGLSRGVVSRSLGSLEAKSLIAREKRQDRDTRKRERESKEHYYVFSEDVEHALEFAAETLELRRRSIQPSLLFDFPNGSTVARIGIISRPLGSFRLGCLISRRCPDFGPVCRHPGRTADAVTRPNAPF